MAGFIAPSRDIEAGQRAREKPASASPPSATGGFIAPQSERRTAPGKSGTKAPELPTGGLGGEITGYPAARADIEKEWSDTPGHNRYNAGESFAQGMTFGTSDEANALGDYIKTSLRDSMLGRVLNKGKALPYSPADAWKASMDIQQEQKADYDAKHNIQAGPISVAPYEIAGAAALPWGGFEAALNETGMGSGLLRAATMGATGGAAAGAGSSRGGPLSRTGGAVGGAIVGAPTGGALHALGGTLSNFGRPIRAAIGEALSRVRDQMGWEPGKPLTPEQVKRGEEKGAEWVREHVATKDPTGEKLKADRREKAGLPVTAAEALGRETMTSLKALGRRGGQTPDALESQLRSRIEETPAYVVEDFGKVAGLKPAEIAGDFAEHVARLREAAKPLYEKAYAKGEIDSPALQNLMNRPSMQAAVKKAFNLAREEGRDPASVGFVTVMKPVVLDGKPIMNPATGQPLMLEHQEMTSKPTMQTWDYINRALGDRLEDFRDGTTKQMKWTEESRGILGTKDALKKELFKLNPDYEKAVNAGGEPLQLEEAYKDVRRQMTPNVNGNEFSKWWSKLTPAQRDAARAGQVNDALNKANNGRQRLKDMLTPAYKGKLTTMYGLGSRTGKPGAKQLIQMLQDRADMVRDAQRMMPGVGSDTSETILAAKEQDQAAREGLRAIRHIQEGKPLTAVLNAMLSPIVGLRRGAQMDMDRATRDAIGHLLMMPPSALAKALERQNETPADITAVQAFLKRLKAAGGAGALNIGMGAASRAGSAVGDQNRPAVE